MRDISHTTIVPYQHSWKEKFENEKEELNDLFGDAAIVIEHIGSTSIEGLASKPIIDIAVMIHDHNDADVFTEPLSRLGYVFHSMSTERHFYTKGDPIEYHVSIVYANRGGFLPKQLLFRDYLRKHPEVRDEYAQLKLGLLEKYPTGKDGYIEGKSEFVQKILNLAQKE